MKLKLVIVDLQLSRRQKRFLAALAIPLVVLGGGAIAYATVPHSWSHGEVLTADDLNGNFDALDQRLTAVEQGAQNLNADIAELQNPIGARYHISLTQVLPGGAFPPPNTVVNYDTKDYDTANAVTTGAAWNFTAPTSGRYLITASLLVVNCSACDNGGAYASLAVFVNGATTPDPLDLHWGWVGGATSVGGSDVRALSAGDVLDLRFSENSLGSADGTAGAITITRVGD